MLLILFALSAHAQPSVYGSYYGAGTSASQLDSQKTINQQRIATPSATSNPPSAPSIFQLRQADRYVRLSESALNGDRAFFNLDLGLFGNNFPPGNPLMPLATAFETDAAAQEERYFQREIDHIRATTPRITQEVRNKIEDYSLQRDYAYNTKLRRGLNFVPLLNDFDGPDGLLGTLSNVYDVRAKKLGWIWAQNQLTDAKRAYEAEPSRENYIALRNARDDVAQADHRQDASSYDLLGGAFGNAATLGPVFRKKASETKLESGLRSLRLAREVYAKNPSEENRINLQMANLFVRVTEEEDATNQNDIVVNLLVNDLDDAGRSGFLWNSVLSGKNTEDESRLWLKHARLARQKLLYQRASAMQSSPVAAQMLRRMDLAKPFDLLSYPHLEIL